MEKQLQEMNLKIDTHESRISSTEAITVSLFSKMDNLVTVLAEQTKEQAVSNANQTHQAETTKRIFSEIDKLKDVSTANTKELDVNRNTLKVINQLPLQLGFIAIMVMGLCAFVIYKAIAT